MIKHLSPLIVSALLSFSAFGADNHGDSNADADTFISNVHQSKGVILRVEVNSNGEELGESASIKLHTADMAIHSTTDIASLFHSEIDASTQPTVSPDEVSKDSSTSGWFGYRRSGWYRPYYYNYYNPSYYYYGHYYPYGQATYYWNYWPGYRYYYYPRVW